MTDALKDKCKAADRITERTGIEDAYEIVDRAGGRAREYLTDELDTDVISIHWIEEAAEVIAAGSAFEQVEYLREYEDGGDLHVAPTSYEEMRRRVGLEALEGVLDLGYYEDGVVLAIDGALRVASEVVKDAIT